MLARVLLVIVLLVVGDSLVELFSLPVPGPALGLLALLCALVARGRTDPETERLFDLASPYFPLCFVPAAVGVIANLDMVSRDWLAIVTAIVLSTACALILGGRLMQYLLAGKLAETGAAAE